MSYPPPPRRRNRIALIVTGLALLAVVALVVVVVVASPGAITGTAVRSPSEQLTDEEQIEASVEAFEKAWNDGDFSAFDPVLCSGAKATDEFTEDEFLEARDMGGKLNLTVESVDVDGDEATADVANEGENNQDITLVREDGEWKWCQF
ncbi:nuclear transport factor 2 family protein [Mycolicibacterium sediminis]|uniref:DUF4878 domain-containing protein n=1 Tax=Mycolicibacterium sediminis TaxID=1286180 RepID=A0A7I7QMW4_9MYCO|nr:nuclear transport factor 2 family protein [Mycolicibacterium sediminis]BBY27729.1 hypothetical protein MSEDJ_18250 [Mycolicibacterium sediminis]